MEKNRNTPAAQLSHVGSRSHSQFHRAATAPREVTTGLDLPFLMNSSLSSSDMVAEVLSRLLLNFWKEELSFFSMRLWKSRVAPRDFANEVDWASSMSFKFPSMCNHHLEVLLLSMDYQKTYGVLHPY